MFIVKSLLKIARLLRMNVLEKIICVIILLFWSIIGFIFWIPLLVRVVASYAGNIVYKMVSDSNIDVDKSSMLFDKAIAFYSTGFIKIIETFSNKSSNPANSTPAPKEDSRILYFFAQLFWTFLFWGMLIVSLFWQSIALSKIGTNIGLNEWTKVEFAPKHLEAVNSSLSLNKLNTEKLVFDNNNKFTENLIPKLYWLIAFDHPRFSKSTQFELTTRYLDEDSVEMGKEVSLVLVKKDSTSTIYTNDGFKLLYGKKW